MHWEMIKLLVSGNLFQSELKRATLNFFMDSWGDKCDLDLSEYEDAAGTKFF